MTEETITLARLIEKYETPTQPRLIHNVYKCPECGKRVKKNHNHCHFCGKRIKWEGIL
ncbi:MAG: hypothetical protein J6S85_10255 [Methanobrevibacter sp.]|nr:hypothetical protein [Methanobrevibacter sp.]